jgi:hypothetical protein
LILKTKETLKYLVSIATHQLSTTDLSTYSSLSSIYDSTNSITNSIITSSSSLKFNSTTSLIGFFGINNTGVQLNDVLSTYTVDLSSCLANCSNQGICELNSFEQYVCQCNQFRMGASCQTDSRPCSSSPCLNKGTCSNVMDNNKTSFRCNCEKNLYFGVHCEHHVNLCSNNTEICFNNQGYCIMNGTKPMCKCFMDYSGNNCEIMSTSLVVKKAIINVSTITAIIVIVCFIIMIISFDYTKYFLMRNKIMIKKRAEIIKFQYHPWRIEKNIKK